jgi:hypothetical protein
MLAPTQRGENQAIAVCYGDRKFSGDIGGSLPGIWTDTSSHSWPSWTRIRGPSIGRQVELSVYDLPSGRLTQVTHDNPQQRMPVWMD